jgi:hypothetical protein
MIQIPDDYVVTDELCDVAHRIEVERACALLELDEPMSRLLFRRVPTLRKTQVESVLAALRELSR